MKKLLIALLFLIPLEARAQISEVTDSILYIGKQVSPMDGVLVQKTYSEIDRVARGRGMTLSDRFISIGALVRCQFGFGACYGYQFNFVKRGPDWYVSKYRLIAVFAGYAQAMKLELYLAGCFGNCMEDHQSGWYGTADVMGTVPTDSGVNLGVFLEAGQDLTDILDGKPLSLSQASVYVGAGIDIGYGYGVSVGAYHYSQMWRKKLNQVTLSDLEML